MFQQSTGPVGPRLRRRDRLWPSVCGGAILVALLLVGFAILQKLIMGLPASRIFTAKAHIVPFGFGAAVGGFLGLYHHRLRRSNQQLAQSLGRLKAIMDTVPVGILLVDMANQVIVEANSFALELLGWPREDLVGHSCPKLICPSEVGGCPFASIPTPTMFPEKVMLSAKGERIPVLKTATVVDLDGRRLLLESFQDLRQQVLLETQLQHAQRVEMLGKTTAGVVHDFNNILSAVCMSVELVGERAENPEAVRQHAAAAMGACAQGVRLVRGLQSFSRKAPVDPRPMDLNMAVHEILGILQHLIPPEISLCVQLHPEPLEIWGDRGQLGQVLLNLAVNARDAMPQGGRLEIRTALWADDPGSGRTVLLEIRDTGCGIPANQTAHIFDAFFSTKGPEKGSGLGLSIVKGIVEQHRGSIQVESAPGAGSLFRILLPSFDPARLA